MTAIRRASFEPLGWFLPEPADGAPDASRFIILIGNAGPGMFSRFARERDTAHCLMDDWTREVVDSLAAELDAQAFYPFDIPALPFLAWARRAGAGHHSPLGLNIHPRFGLWHAYRAALSFPVAFDLPRHDAGPNPCDTCETRPCLSSCPVAAFTGRSYDVAACARHISSPAGTDCMRGGCLARRACPVGQTYTYAPEQMNFHMRAFLKARRRLNS